MKTPTIADVAAAILEASSRLADSENTRYPFNCANAAITADRAGNVYCGTSINPDPEDTELMEEEWMAAEITEDMTQADAVALAERVIAEIED